MLSGNGSAGGQSFLNLFVTQQEHFTAYCVSMGANAIYVPDVTVQPDRDLQQSSELHFS
jgi:tryptophan synthase alpha subunit